jgi:hypothetical protein
MSSKVEKPLMKILVQKFCGSIPESLPGLFVFAKRLAVF